MITLAAALRFRDGTSGAIVQANALRRPVFELLLDPMVFSHFRVDPEFHTPTWLTGGDFAREFPRDNIRVTV